MSRYLAILLLFPTLVFAGKLQSPDRFIEYIIERVQSESSVDQMVDFERMSKDPRHSLTKKEFTAKMKKIDVSKIEFQKTQYRYSNNPVIVRMIHPLNLDFELEKRETDIKVKPHKWVLISVHP